MSQSETIKVLYYNDKLPDVINKSIFLAGPSLRPGQEGVSWRKDALQILEDMGYDGFVFVPENEDGKFDEDHSYSDTVQWEEVGLNVADAIVFWVPREVESLPGFTTNIEWGRWESSGKIVLGYPEDAEKMKYIQHYADKLNITTHDSLSGTLATAIKFVGEGAERSGGERYVPLYIWNTPQFQNWYAAQKSADNKLNSARVLYSFRPGNKSFVFMFVLQVDVYVAAEDRNKTNEFVLSRTDVSSVVLWRRHASLENSEIVLVREFRSPAATSDGFIRELAGGSSKHGDTDPIATAAEEVSEEVGLELDPDRIRSHAVRQLAGTLSSHKSHLYSVELTEKEIGKLKDEKDKVHGNIEDTEMTYVEVVTFKDLLAGKVEVDWSTLGQIFSVVLK